MSFAPHPGALHGRGAWLTPLSARQPGAAAALPLAAARAVAGALFMVASRISAGALPGAALRRVEPSEGEAGETAQAPSLEFADFVYELLDAHADTAELASRLELDVEWHAHLEYLRALQRHGRGLLAQVSPASSLAA